MKITKTNTLTRTASEKVAELKDIRDRVSRGSISAASAWAEASDVLFDEQSANG